MTASELPSKDKRASKPGTDGGPPTTKLEMWTDIYNQAVANKSETAMAKAAIQIRRFGGKVPSVTTPSKSGVSKGSDL